MASFTPLSHLQDKFAGQKAPNVYQRVPPLASGPMPYPYDETNLPLTAPTPSNTTSLTPMASGAKTPSILGQILTGVGNSNLGAQAPVQMAPPGMPTSPENMRPFQLPQGQGRSLLSRFTQR